MGHITYLNSINKRNSFETIHILIGLYMVDFVKITNGSSMSAVYNSGEIYSSTMAFVPRLVRSQKDNLIPDVNATSFHPS